MTQPITHSPRITVNVYDVEGLHEAAIEAYCKSGASRADAEGFLGTSDAPNLTNCLVELWAEYSPASAGYEFVNFE